MKDKIAEIDKLLPCPFCGGEAETKMYLWGKHAETGEPIWCFYVFCQSCDAMTDNIFKSKQEAIAAWNQRAYIEQGQELEHCQRAFEEACRQFSYGDEADYKVMLDSIWDLTSDIQIGCTDTRPGAALLEELAQYKRALELACDNLEIYTSSTKEKWVNYYLSQSKAGDSNA